MSSLSRILAAEDQVVLLLDLIDNLADHGIEAVPATSARAAAHLLDDSIDALITDIEMPGDLNGLDLARHAARLRPGLPIVVVSGGIRPSASELPAGTIFLSKPYSMDDVLAALGRQQHAHAA